MRFATFAACAALCAATAASAQDYPADRDYSSSVSYQRGSEVVTVEAPRYQGRDSVTGAPIQNIQLSEAVRFDDLDLRTREGARVLRERIRTTAQRLCRRLGESYAPGAGATPPCYDDAVGRAMEQADAAVADARSYNE